MSKSIAKIAWRRTPEEVSNHLAERIQEVSGRYVEDSDGLPYEPEVKLELVTAVVQGENKVLKHPLPKNKVDELIRSVLDGTWQRPAVDDNKPKLQGVVPPVIHRIYEMTKKMGVEETEKFVMEGVKKRKEEKAIDTEIVPIEEEGFHVINGKGAVLKRIRWCWPGRLAFGKLNLFCGNPDHGKSLASLDVVAKVTTGSDWYDCKNAMDPIEVLIVAAEDGWEDTIAPRLVSANADLSKIHYLKSVVATLKDNQQIKRTLQLDSDVKFLEKFLNEHPKVRLIVIDPVSSYLGRAKMGDEQAVRDVLNPLAALAEKTGICVLVIMHLNKKVDLDAVNRVGGAMAFVGVPRLAWIFAKKSEDESDDDEDPDREPVEQDNTIFMMKLKGNIVKAGNGGLTFLTEARELQIEEGRDWIPYVKWTGTTQKSLEELSSKKRQKRKGPAADKKSEIRLWLMDFLKGGAKPVGGVDGIHEHAKQMFGASDATVERAKHELGLKAEHIAGENGKKRWFWSLPETDAQEAIGF